MTPLIEGTPFIYGAIMNRKKIENKSEKRGKSITFRIDGELEKEFLATVNTGASKTEVVNAALRLALPQLKQDFHTERLKKMGLSPIEAAKKAKELYQKEFGAHLRDGNEKDHENSK
jgi:Arc/MetJ-type ribon-helix-helix transcriptional regulator